VAPGKTAEVADLERTFLDAVDRQDLCGGIEEVVRGFARRHDDLDRERLLRYVVEFDAPVVTKRLGFLLEIVGHGDTRLLRELERLAVRMKRYTLLAPGGGAVVERSKRWELEINADPERLMDAVTT
jgi:predicted transcriptional regulator of viral defense system